MERPVGPVERYSIVAVGIEGSSPADRRADDLSSLSGEVETVGGRSTAA